MLCGLSYHLDHSFDKLNAKVEVEELGTSRVSSKKDKKYIKHL